MSVVTFILGFWAGLIVTVLLLVWCVATEEGGRRLARWQAEQRIRDVETAAMGSMADAVEGAVRRSTGLGFTDHGVASAATAWPSEAGARHSGGDVIEGVVVVDDRREG